MIYDEHQHGLHYIVNYYNNMTLHYIPACKKIRNSFEIKIHSYKTIKLISNIIVLYNKNDDNNNNRYTHTVYSVILYILYRSIKYKICAFYTLQSLDV